MTNRKKLLAALCLASAAMAQIASISGERIRAHVKFLASDLLEGRGVGARGGDLAAAYIASQFAIAGAKPAGDNGTYFQRVPMLGVSTQPGAALSADGHGKRLSFGWLDDFVGVSQLQKPQDQFDGEAIFAGHGIVAPEFNWDDFKGVDVHGKVLILFTNEPPSDDPKFFGGKALTYYGRWTYKYEEAARLGAAAVLLIHTAPTASYGWDVVRSSWGKEDPQVRLPVDGPALAFAGWLTKDAGDKLLRMSGNTVDDLLAQAETRDFKPIPLGIRVRGNIPSKIRDIESRNVAAIVSGSDAQLKSQAVIFSAHWDHLGVADPVNGDTIYNGAVDNATGCGILLELARAWAGLQSKPRRSALFLAVTAEEAGLRGSEYYAEHPITPLNKTALDVNFDAFFPFGRTKDVEVSGAERTTVWPIVQEAARRMNVAIRPNPHPERGEYYRSDHFSFAHAGIPAFSIGLGNQLYGKPADYGEKMSEEYLEKHYHQPSDEYHEDWDFAGMVEAARFGMLIGMNVANQEKLPTWKAADEFLPARQRSGVQ